MVKSLNQDIPGCSDPGSTMICKKKFSLQQPWMETQAAQFGEVAKILVSSDERELMVEADLGNERIGEQGLASLLEELGPQGPDPFPIALRQSQ